MRSTLLALASIITTLGFASSAHATLCNGPQGYRNYPPQVCYQMQRRRPNILETIVRRSFGERRVERGFVERRGYESHEVIHRNARPHGPTVVTHLVEFDDGQSYCSKYIPGTRFVRWIGSGPSRKAHCE